MKWLSNVPANLLVILALLSCARSGAQPQEAGDPAEIKLEIRLIELDGVAQKQVGFDYLGEVPADQVPPEGVKPPTPQIFPTGSGPAAGAMPTPGTNAIGTMTGLLTDPQFRMVIRALEQRSNTRTLAAPEGVTLSGTPMVLQRPDGWKIEVAPTRHKGSDKITMSVALSQDKGEYAGFSLASTVRVASGEAAVFSDTFSTPPKKTGAEPVRKRLFLTVLPRLIE